MTRSASKSNFFHVLICYGFMENISFLQLGSLEASFFSRSKSVFVFLWKWLLQPHESFKWLLVFFFVPFFSLVFVLRNSERSIANLHLCYTAHRDREQESESVRARERESESISKGEREEKVKQKNEAKERKQLKGRRKQCQGRGSNVVEQGQ